MIKQMYAIRNANAQVYWPPVFMDSEDEMADQCRFILASEGDDFKNPSNFSVWFLGTYDTDSGKFEANAPEHCFNIVDL